MKKISIILTSLLLLSACQDDDTIGKFGVNSESSEVAIRRNMQRAIITAEKGLKSLHTNASTRSIENFEIESITPIIYSKAQTRAYGETDTTLYLINYKEDGFALVGAGKYADKTFALSEEGHLELNDTIQHPILADLINNYSEFVANDVLERDVASTQDSDPIVDVFYYQEPLISCIWDQRNGFNGFFSNNNPAGCVPIAIGQLCFYYRFPSSFRGYNFDWSKMRLIKKSADLTRSITKYRTGSSQVKRFIHELALEMHTDANGGTPFDSISYGLQSLGYLYTSVHLHWSSDIKWNILDHAIPSLIYGSNEVDSIPHAHVWVVDGYRETDTKTWDSSISDYQHNYEYMFHCNWGWGGSANGYYKYYDITNTDIEYDPSQGADWGGDGTTQPYSYISNFYSFTPIVPD